jgi:hypothetical protein
MLEHIRRWTTTPVARRARGRRASRSRSFGRRGSRLHLGAGRTDGMMAFEWLSLICAW